MPARWLRRFLGLRPLAFLALLLAAGQVTGLAAYESYRGFYAPAWGPERASLYFVERRTTGLVFGFGWEFFTPPAHSFVLDDRVKLRRVSVADGTVETLLTWPSTPVAATWAQRYRGRVFGSFSADTRNRAGGEVAYAIGVSGPDGHSVGATGVWSPDATPAAWEVRMNGRFQGLDEDRLRDGVEAITVPGAESYPAAILAVPTAGDPTVVVAVDGFDRRYPDGVPDAVIDRQSRRKAISRALEFRDVLANRTDYHRAQGLAPSAARVRAYDDMASLGYLPVGPLLVAKVIEAPTGSLPVFRITETEFRVGLFRDIAAAIEHPGKAVEKPGYAYTRHEAFDTAPRLNAWLAEHDRFVVAHDGTFFDLTIYRD